MFGIFQSLVMKSSKDTVQAAAKEFLQFVNKGASPYHGKKKDKLRSPSSLILRPFHNKKH